ncbi:TPA: glycogen debranching protein GlgX [Morganella morganii]|uniref:glycogen debranching protein GlgX n=1 Tax=Morganella morganii TaxID=582 RepID=UPI001A2BA4D6|nr:glycogen debranching protein GlgX [Morganella morganii]HDQ2581617.1 glycogen debranching protein GlgX [Morganella morganii]
MTATLLRGSDYPVGSHFDGSGINFSLFSAHAEKVELCLFDEHGQEQRLALPARTGDVWHGYLAGSKPGVRYGYRVYGPWDPQNGLRFNPQKLLIDPYCRALDAKVPDSPLLVDAGSQPDAADSAPVMPKSIVTHEPYDWQQDTCPRTPWSQSVIYEAHVKGLTKTHPAIPAILRGSYAAVAHPAMINYLKNLGITALELLPVQLHADEPRLQQAGLTNYWGYNVLAPFAIESDYWSGQPNSTPLSEFRDMVRALHTAGIEVILDLVFNHSAELDLEGPTLSLRGADNASYYWLDDQGNYHNWSGCGNTLQLTQPATVKWVMDCLRFWAIECHIDGFRFDLGSVLGRTPEFSSSSPLISAMLQDPIISRLKLIAEPWDIGPDGYQLGQFSSPFTEWNDRFRDDIRRFWLQGSVPLGQFARRYAASSDIFNRHGRRPWASVNKITSHDGFTLNDLVSFNHKHNQANGEDNRDGNSQNYSNNHGTEGLEADDQTLDRRAASQRALLTTLLLSQGTPMLLAGDESGHSQQGNNNAYCQDSPLTWLNWIQADDELMNFTRGLINLRQKIPALTTCDWWTGEVTSEKGDRDVDWLNAQGQRLSPQQWEQGEQQVLQILLSGSWLIAINTSNCKQTLILPAGSWLTSQPFSLREVQVGTTDYQVMPRTICVLQQK